MTDPNVPPRKPADEPWNRPRVRTWALAAGVWLALLGISHFVAWAAYGVQTSATTVRIPTPFVSGVLRGGFCLAWIVGPVWIAMRTRRLLATLTITGTVAFLTLFTAGFVSLGRTMCHDEDRMTSADGTEYVALWVPDLIDDYQMLAEVDEANWLVEHLTVLRHVEGTPGEAGGWFRPARHATNDGLYLDELGNGTVALLWNDEDGNHGVVVAMATDGSDAWVPAFAFFRPDDTGDDAHLKETVAGLARALDRGANAERWFTDEQLVRRLDHGSPWVRHAARTLIETGGWDHYPKGMHRLAESR